VTPEFLSNQLEEAAHAQDWTETDRLVHEFLQDCAVVSGWRGLESQSRTVLLSACDQPTVRKIDSCLGNLRQFEVALERAVDEAINRAAGRSDIVAIYCEYFFDGGDGSSMDLFLCDRYTPTDDDWASHFGSSDVVSGPSVESLLSYDPEFELDGLPSVVADMYAYSKLLCAFGSLVSARADMPLPFAFAQHEGAIIYLKPLANLGIAAQQIGQAGLPGSSSR